MNETSNQDYAKIMKQDMNPQLNTESKSSANSQLGEEQRHLASNDMLQDIQNSKKSRNKPGPSKTHQTNIIGVSSIYTSSAGKWMQ